jgi:hypothetical protein
VNKRQRKKAWQGRWRYWALRGQSKIYVDERLKRTPMLWITSSIEQKEIDKMRKAWDEQMKSATWLRPRIA